MGSSTYALPRFCGPAAHIAGYALPGSRLCRYPGAGLSSIGHPRDAGKPIITTPLIRPMDLHFSNLPTHRTWVSKGGFEMSIQMMSPATPMVSDEPDGYLW